MKNSGPITSCLLLSIALLQTVSGFSPTGLQSKHIICPSSSAFSTSSASPQCTIDTNIFSKKSSSFNSNSSSRLYMSDAAIPEKKGFVEKVSSFAKYPNILSYVSYRQYLNTQYSFYTKTNNLEYYLQMKSKIPPASERKKLVPLASMFFFILFNYTILRDTKDVLMITAKKSGAEVIPFIKTYVNLPVSHNIVIWCILMSSYSCLLHILII